MDVQALTPVVGAPCRSRSPLQGCDANEIGFRSAKRKPLMRQKMDVHLADFQLHYGRTSVRGRRQFDRRVEHQRRQRDEGKPGDRLT